MEIETLEEALSYLVWGAQEDYRKRCSQAFAAKKVLSRAAVDTLETRR